MSSFLHPSNQEVIWKVLHNIPSVETFSYEKKVFIFQNAMKEVYNTFSNAEISIEELKQANKKVIDIIQKSISVEKNDHVLNKNVQPVYTSTKVYETQFETTSRNFEEKKEIYNKMTEKPNIPESKDLFKEPNCDDTKITNMDELIEEHQKQREYDLEIYKTSPNEKNKTNDREEQSLFNTIIEKIELLEKRIYVLEKYHNESSLT